MAFNMTGQSPLLVAVSSSARQLFQLLRCIAFNPRAQVQVLPDGIRFSIDEFSYMEATVYLEKSLFTTYRYNPELLANAQPEEDTQDEDNGVEAPLPPPFSISLPSILETLQIFGVADSRFSAVRDRDPYATVFTNQAVGITSLCRLRYDEPGAPLVIHLEEGSVRTTCELLTYEPSTATDIPFARDALAMKIIVGGPALLDAITELGTMSPEKLNIAVHKDNGTFTLSSVSTIGSAQVEFRNGDNSRSRQDSEVPGQSAVHPGERPQASLLETFQASQNYSQTYKLAHILHAKRAMASAVKVSVRADGQGVLSLQFMIENIEGSGVSFVDFRFVPLLEEEGDENGDTNNDETDSE